MCMETGQTVVLLNMEKLYESLYDALNQVKPILNELSTIRSKHYTIML